MQQRHRTRGCAKEYTRLRREEKRVHRSKKHALEEQNMRELEQTREGSLAPRLLKRSGGIAHSIYKAQ